MVVFVEEQIPFLSESLEKVSNLFTFPGRRLTCESLISSNCEILFVRSTTKVNRNLIENTKVKFVGSATSGIDHIDLDYLQSKNIYFTDAKGSNANSVAEYVIFSILHWASENKIDLKGLPIGIIGYGNIGSLVAKYSFFLGMNVFINDPPLLEAIHQGQKEHLPSFLTYLDLDDLLKNCLIITNHVPLTSNSKYPTLKLLDKDKINLIPDNCLFIHTSRGGIVSENDLLQIKRKKNFTLVIDVWENEPNINTELIKESAICSPHIAGYSYDGKLRGALKMLNEFEKFTSIKPDYSKIEKELANYKRLETDFFQNPVSIYDKLIVTRRILDDTQQFKKILSFTNSNQIAKYFDDLRKNYPTRREIL